MLWDVHAPLMRYSGFRGQIHWRKSNKIQYNERRAIFKCLALALQALIRKDGPDPVSRAVQMTKISFPAALNLVSEFMDGSALNLARLMKDIAKARFWKLTVPAVWIGTLTPEVDLD